MQALAAKTWISDCLPDIFKMMSRGLSVILAPQKIKHKDSTAKGIAPNDERIVQLLVFGTLWSSLVPPCWGLEGEKSTSCPFAHSEGCNSQLIVLQSDPFKSICVKCMVSVQEKRETENHYVQKTLNFCSCMDFQLLFPLTLHNKSSVMSQ